MSRHRNVRNAVYDDYDDEDDYRYGQSVEDECISPTDAQQWIYDRAKGQQSMSEFLANNRDIEEEDDDELAADRAREGSSHKERRDSECYQLPELNDENRARLLSCMDEIRDIVGETVSDRQMVEAIMKHEYDCTKALDEILNSNKTPPSAARSGNKLSNEPVEKDLKAAANPMTPNAPHVPSFTLPKVQFSSGIGGNLSDLVKLRLQHEAKQTATTEVGVDEVVKKESMKAASLTAQPETPLAMSLASLAIGKAPVATESPGKAFSNLSELAKHHLKSQGTPPTFPSASTSTASGPGTVPTLFKIPLGFGMGLPGREGPSAAKEDATGSKSSETKQSLAGNGWILDLKSALIKNKKDILAPSVAGQEKKGEHIQYGFIDCDLKETIKPIIDEFCTIDASSVLEMDLTKHRTLQASALGAVLSLRYRKRKLPTEVLHQFRPNTTVVPFRFDGPSPDDMVLGHIKKIRR